MPHTTRFSDKFLVRLPDGMRDQLAEAARANRRSMTAEISHRLQASFDAEQQRDRVVIDSKSGVVLHLTLTPGMTVEEVLDLLAAAHMALPADTSLVMD
jgi:plasmid stability protein